MSKINRQPDLLLPLLVPAEDPPTVERLCIDDMLIKYCGEFGPWQQRHFVLTSIVWALEAFHAMVIIFADRDPAWHCIAGNCLATELCKMEPSSWEWVGGPRSSTVAEFGLICTQKYKVGLVQALFFAGCMIGAGVFGHLSDTKLGRRGSLLVVCLLNAIFGCLTALSPNYWTYAMCRIFTGFSTGGSGLCAFVLATEPIGPTNRGMAGISTFYFFSGGIAALSGIAYFFQSWRALYIASSIPSILFLFFILPFVSESPRWYLIRGRIDRAMNIMHRIAQSNGKSIPDGVVLALDDTSDKLKSNDDETKGALGGTIVDVLRSPIIRHRFFLAVPINFFWSIVYYGLSLNVANLGTNVYLNAFLNSVFQMPACLVTTLLLDRCGRKPLAIGTQWFSGIFCVMGGLLKCYGSWEALQMVCGILGIFGTAGAYNLLFIYTVELFPTTVRNAVLGCASLVSEMGAILAPIVVVLGGGVPFWVFSVCGIFGGILGIFLPETLHKPLYDTIKGMEDGER